MDLAHVYTMDDLKKLQQAGASAEELRQAHQIMKVVRLLVEKGASLDEDYIIKRERSKKAKEIRQVDSDTGSKPVDHFLRRALFGGKQRGKNAPLNPAVAERLKKRQSRS